MQTFFPSLDALERYTSSLNYRTRANCCQHCEQSDQWVSHGYVYKQRSAKHGEVVGKRILCSRRYGKTGCGRSHQLYLQSTLPKRHCSIQTFVAFVMLLIKGLCVAQAYRQACARPHIDPRHAWRWINSMSAQLGQWRTTLGRCSNNDQHDTHYRTRRLNILLPTLRSIFPTPDQAMAFQCHHQQPAF